MTKFINVELTSRQVAMLNVNHIVSIIKNDEISDVYTTEDKYKVIEPTYEQFKQLLLEQQ